MEDSLKITLNADWDEIELVRKRGSKFLKYHGFSDDDVHSLVMVISELIENSIKYGNFKKSQSKVSVTLNITKNLITIEVNNPVDEKTAYDLRRLDRTIQWIRGYQDSFEAYIERMKEISKKPLQDDESGLGLVRIAYEGKAILDFFVREDNILNVSAVTKI
jgi:hypothetical protein